MSFKEEFLFFMRWHFKVRISKVNSTSFRVMTVDKQAIDICIYTSKKREKSIREKQFMKVVKKT